MGILILNTVPEPEIDIKLISPPVFSRNLLINFSPKPNPFSLVVKFDSNILF